MAPSLVEWRDQGRDYCIAVTNKAEPHASLSPAIIHGKLRPSSRFFIGGEKPMRKIYPSVLPFLAIFCALLLPLSAAAQETTSAIRGKVVNNQGEAAVAASVVLEDTRTGMTRRYTTN